MALRSFREVIVNAPEASLQEVLSLKSVSEVIVVEGKYDKNTVLQSIHATVIETSGFGLFSDNDKIALLKRLADKRGLIILTDGDSAGFLIRNRLRGIINESKIKHAYVPDILGKERRKSKPSKENKLGVEGMSPQTIIEALQRAGASFDDNFEPVLSKSPITKTDFYIWGLTGGVDSKQKRNELLKQLELPERLSANGLMAVLNALYAREEFISKFIDVTDIHKSG